MKQDYETKPLGHDDDEGAISSKQGDELDEPEEAGAGEEDSGEEGVELTDPEEESPDEEEFDYEAELEKERARLGKKVDKERDRRLAAERSRGLTAEQVEKMIADKVGVAEKRVLRNRAEELADRLAKSDSERNLILHHFDHSIVASGSLEEDIENAYALANRRKFKATISELRAAARSKETRVGSSGAGAPATPAKKPLKFTQEDVDGARFAGVSVEEFAKARILNESKQ